MSEYQQVKIGKLRLKGSGSSDTKKKKKKKRTHDALVDDNVASDSDTKTPPGGWWVIKSFDNLLAGNVALQVHNGRHVIAVDNGTLSLGDYPEDAEARPDEAEIFTLIRISDTKVALKTGFGKYVSVNARGEVTARVEAVGPQEQLDVVIENEKMALQGHNGYFITVTDSGEIKSLSRTASEKEMIIMRTNTSRVKKRKDEEDADAESVMNVRQCEINYVKQFQSFGDHKMRLHQGPQSSLEKARKVGKLHEAMLDRREKMKADRYCK